MRDRMAISRSGRQTPIRCRVCLRKMGDIRDFEGQVFMLCEVCEEALRRRKKGNAKDAKEKPKSAKPLHSAQGGVAGSRAFRALRTFAIMLGVVIFFCGVEAGAAQPGRPAPAPGPVTLDLDPARGDQGKREVRGVRPGVSVAVEVVALRGAKGATGFMATLRFDTTQVAYEGFEAGPLIPEMQTLPLLRDGTLEIGGGQLGAGAGAAQDAGPLGILRFKITPRFKDQTTLTLTRARFRRRGQTQDFEGHTAVVLYRRQKSL